MKKSNLKKIKDKINNIYKTLFKKIITGHLFFLKHTFGIVPISIKYWNVVRKIFYYIGLQEPDVLFPAYEILIGKGDSLKDLELRRILADDILGEWSLDDETITFLWDSLRHDKPRVILECGAGVSTMILAIYASLASKKYGGDYLIISLEQNHEVKVQVEERLKKNNLKHWVKLIYAPLDGKEMYRFDDFSEKSLSKIKVDWMLIDGPSGSPHCRCAVLPVLLKYCHGGTRWFLDDAFREGELDVLQRWQNIPGIRVEGIYPIGKGLATGRCVV